MTTHRRRRGRAIFSAHEEREVPGDDLAHHPEGLPQDDAQGVLVDHHRLALLGAGGGREITEMVGAQRHVDGGGLPDGLAVVQGLHHGQPGGVGVDQVGYLEQHGRPGLGTHVLPGPVGLPSGGHRGVDILLAGIHAGGQELAVGGVEGLEGLASRARDPLAGDEKLITVVVVLGHLPYLPA